MSKEMCDIKLVESIPEGLDFPNSHIPRNPSTYSAFLQLLNVTESSLELASSYWSLRGSDVYEDPSDWQGEDVYQKIHDLATSGNVKIKIAQDLPKKHIPNKDTEDLSRVCLYRYLLQEYRKNQIISSIYQYHIIFENYVYLDTRC